MVGNSRKLAAHQIQLKFHHSHIFRAMKVCLDVLAHRADPRAPVFGVANGVCGREEKEWDRENVRYVWKKTQDVEGGKRWAWRVCGKAWT